MVMKIFAATPHSSEPRRSRSGQLLSRGNFQKPQDARLVLFVEKKEYRSFAASALQRETTNQFGEKQNV